MTDTTPGPDHESVVTLDQRTLRALAHPARMRLLSALRRDGTSTVTQLAETTGVSTGTASYHLRQLADSAFVEEDTARGNGRERWWRSVHRMTSLNADALFDEDPEATLTFLQSVAAHYTQRIQQGIAAYQTLPGAWRGAADFSDYAVRVTPDEAVRLREELHAVARRYRQDGQEAADAPPEGAERVTVLLTVLPEPADHTAPGHPAPGSHPRSTP